MTETPPRPPVGWRWVTSDLALSVAATLLSLCAVVTTVWQTSIMREQLRLSVWPRVRLDFRYLTDNDDHYFRMKLENVGVGPAIIKSIQTTFRGREVAHLSVAYDVVMAENHASRSALREHTSSSVAEEEVLPQQQSVVLLEVRGGAPSPAELFKKLRPDLRMIVRYASIYGELWETGFPDGSTRRIGRADIAR
jgi:hypothetical protein